MDNRIFTALGGQARAPRPRKPGFSMVLDKHLGTRATEDLIETAGEYIDLLKFGWASSALYPDAVLEKKVRLYRDAGIMVCPGGTFIEVAYERGVMPQILDVLKDIGFNAIEVSNGIHPKIDGKVKPELIAMAADKGFFTISEVGKKLAQEDAAISHAQRINEVRADLAAGARMVVMEARESGTVGIFRPDGKINSELAHELFQHVDPDTIIWEAPLKEQQVWLLHQLGPEANIGNIAPTDVLSLESMRHGLRADTFRDHGRSNVIVYLELGVGGAYRAQRRGDVVVVVDALRASATIIDCLQRGARQITPVLGADELSGNFSIGERGGAKLPNAVYSNSTTELRQVDLRDAEMTITTTNGTECIHMAKGPNNPVLIGSVTNARAVAEAAVALARKEGRGITLLAAGRNNLPAVEDRIGVTAILDHIENAVVKGTLEPYYSDNFEKDFLGSDSGVNLATLGYAADVLFAAQLNSSTTVPIYDGKTMIAHPGC